MNDAPGPERAKESWSGVLLPLLDHVAPADPVRAVTRARTWLVTGAIGAWLLPRSALVHAETSAIVIRTSVAFGVAALFVHLVRRRPWGGREAAIAAVVAAAVAGGGPWAILIAALVVVSFAASAVRRRFLPGDDFVPALGGLGGIAWGFVGVLIFREFAMLPIHVPTGSMEPTIYGNRAYAMGDHILVGRAKYAFGDPHRFDICVFDFPLHRPTTFVKRLIGLPGETVEIRDGDLWIDGRIAQKPPLVQDGLWREIFPKPNPLAQAKSIPSAWTSADRSAVAGWTVEGDGVRCKGYGKDVVLRFTPRLDRGDVRVRFDAEMSGEYAATVRVRTRGHVVDVVVDIDSTGERSGAVRIDGASGATFDGEIPDEVFVADGAVVVRRGGRELARADVPTEGPNKHGIELVVTNGAVAFRNLRVDRDQAWLPASDGTTTWTVPAGSYFVLGDHAERSEDSREWKVTEFRVRGRAEPIRAATTYPSDTGAPVPNVRRDGGYWTFRDVNDLPQRIARADVESKRDGIPAPFIPRSHFLGRAAVVFWPWVPAEGGFRPRMLP